MKSTAILFLVCVGCLSSLLTAADSGVSIEVVGMTVRGAGGDYQVSFGDVCTLTMGVDREYKILAAKMKGWPGVVGYTLAPADGNSALSVGFGEPKKIKSDEVISKSPGFTQIVRKKILVGAQEFEFREWSDSQHLYSDGVVALPVAGSSPERRMTVIISIVTNSEQRRKALEDSMRSLILKEPISEASAAPERAAGPRLNKPERRRIRGGNRYADCVGTVVSASSAPR